MIIFSDFASNNGVNPLVAARQMKSNGVPVVTVALGTENAGAGSRDIRMRDIATSPTMFVKNKIEVKGTLQARGFANRTLDVELFVEDQIGGRGQDQREGPRDRRCHPHHRPGVHTRRRPARRRSRSRSPFRTASSSSHEQRDQHVRHGPERRPERPVPPGIELVLGLQVHDASSLAGSHDIQVEGVLIRRPRRARPVEVNDAEFAPGRYNVFVLSDLPADYLTPTQHRLLVEAVKKGAGLMMLGGHSSFGAGGWADTPLAEILPVQIHPGDGQDEPEVGLKFVPNIKGLNSYVLQVGANKTETARIWDMMPPILGTNRFGEAEDRRQHHRRDAGSQSRAADGGYGSRRRPCHRLRRRHLGLVPILGGEPARPSQVLAADRFLALTQGERGGQPGQADPRPPPGRRRARRSNLTVTARDSKGASIPNVVYEAKVQREKADPPVSRPVEIYNQGEEGKGAVYATEQVGEPGTYTVTVVAGGTGRRSAATAAVSSSTRTTANSRIPPPTALLPSRSPQSPMARPSPRSGSPTTSRVSTGRLTPRTSASRNTSSMTTGRSS